MPFPKTIFELAQQGYTFDSDGKCGGCWAKIEWWITPNKARMPMDVDSNGNCKTHFATCPKAKDFRRKLSSTKKDTNTNSKES